MDIEDPLLHTVLDKRFHRGKGLFWVVNEEDLDPSTGKRVRMSRHKPPSRFTEQMKEDRAVFSTVETKSQGFGAVDVHCLCDDTQGLFKEGSGIRRSRNK
jgi:hypothetical protein